MDCERFSLMGGWIVSGLMDRLRAVFLFVDRSIDCWLQKFNWWIQDWF